MLQNKLLIAMGALTLAACGGSLDLGPKIPAPVQETPGNGNGNGACEIIPGQSFVYDFSEAEQVEDWFINGDGTNVRLEHDAEESAMRVIPLQWADEENWRRQARFQLEETEDLSNAVVTVEFHLPEAYSTDGGLALQLVVQGDEGLYTDNYLGVGSFDPGDNTWTWEMGGANNADYFGFQLAVVPNDETILDDILIYSVTIQTPDEEICDEEPELITLELDLTDGWLTQANYQDPEGEAPPFEYVTEGVMVMIDDVNQQLVKPVDGPIDFRRAEVTFSISVDATYLSTASALQPFQQVFIRGEDEDGEPDNEEVGGNWGCWTGIGTWTEAGEPVDVECNLTNSDMWNLEEGEFMYFGAQSQGDDPQGSFTIHGVTILYYGDGAPEPEVPAPGSELELATDDTGNWSIADDGAAVVYTEAGAAFTPAFDGEYNPKLVYLLDGPVDLGGQQFELEVTVEQAFLEADAILRAHVQLNYGSYTQYQCRFPEDELVAGEAFTLVCDDIPETILAGEGENLRVGIEVEGDGDLGVITISKLSVTVN
ncbi:family 15 carbohydrate-binding domain-containing protein [Marinimicrobium alkaliphilum]|uniref:family 15 carbohydrate-binding domain-containing protein n=1 Tax=Marinimicrobium alkaliphilum TaxID=2202654 RepID=UPI000DB95EB5|nr:family 15 carbohydrate-binding domain-containing protein [Marinimicrobium alkaliphilum]